jgi:hypothetical protein
MPGLPIGQHPSGGGTPLLLHGSGERKHSFVPQGCLSESWKKRARPLIHHNPADLPGCETPGAPLFLGQQLSLWLPWSCKLTSLEQPGGRQKQEMGGHHTTCQLCSTHGNQTGLSLFLASCGHDELGLGRKIF